MTRGRHGNPKPTGCADKDAASSSPLQSDFDSGDRAARQKWKKVDHITLGLYRDNGK